MTVALVPLKRFDAGKQRLAVAFTESQRRRLSTAMTRDVLTALTASPLLSRIVLCAGSPGAHGIAAEFDVEFIDEQTLGTTGLNPTTRALASRFCREGESRLLVCHADLAALRTRDVSHLVRALANADVAIAPDAAQAGSNLLAWRLASGFQPRYGQDSFMRHCQQARDGNLRLQICRADSGRLDIDGPRDLQTLLEHGPTGRTSHTLDLLQEPEIADALAQHGRRTYQSGATHHAV